jgi:hypothetical protein
MHKQVFHIQTLIQENSRLNIKLLSENMENQNPWWKFCKTIKVCWRTPQQASGILD